MSKMPGWLDQNCNCLSSLPTFTRRVRTRGSDTILTQEAPSDVEQFVKCMKFFQSENFKNQKNLINTYNKLFLKSSSLNFFKRVTTYWRSFLKSVQIKPLFNFLPINPDPPNSTQFLLVPPSSTWFFPVPPSSFQILPVPTQFLPIPLSSSQIYPDPPSSSQIYPDPPKSTQFLPDLPSSSQIHPVFS